MAMEKDALWQQVIVVTTSTSRSEQMKLT